MSKQAITKQDIKKALKKAWDTPDTRPVGGELSPSNYKKFLSSPKEKEEDNE